MPPLALSPLSGPPQAVVLEGNYWKRRIEVVMREYHKWRIYYKKRVSGGGPFPLRLLATASLARAPEGFPPQPQPRPCPPLRPRPTAPPSGHRASSQPPYLPGPKSFRGEVRDPVDLGELVSREALAGSDGGAERDPVSTFVCSCSSVSPAGKGISWPQSRWVLPGPREWMLPSGWARQWWWGEGGT